MCLQPSGSLLFLVDIVGTTAEFTSQSDREAPTQNTRCKLHSRFIVVATFKGQLEQNEMQSAQVSDVCRFTYLKDSSAKDN